MSPSSSSHLRGTAWRWLGGLPRQGQTTLVARCHFSAGEPAIAVLRLNVNHLYRLYFNGEALGQGPARSDPRWPLFDTWDLSARLHLGNNTLVVVAVHFDWRPYEETGAFSSGWRLHNGPGGLWAELDVDGRPVDLRWQAKPAAGWQDCPDRINRFLGYQADVDLDAFDRDLAEAFADSPAWPAMVAQSSSELGQPAACPTPPLVPTPREPLRLSLVKPTDTSVGNLSAHQRGDSANPLTITAETWITFDFGRPMGGYPHLDLESIGAADVDVYLGEGSHSRRTDRLHCAAGRYRYQPIDWRGGRTVTLHVRPHSGEVRIHSVRFVEMVYPFQPMGEFACSDRSLTTLWHICRETAWAATKDHLVDCLAREQALWIADVNVHARALYAGFGDPRPVEKALRQALAVTHDDGVMPVPGPCAIGYKRTDQSLPWSEQPLTFAMSLLDLHAYADRRGLIDESLPRLEAMYRLYEPYEDDRGLLCTAPSGLPALMVFGGWNPGLKKGTPTALNFEYVRSLTAAAALADAAGRVDLAEAWRRRADRTCKAAVRAFWDPQRHLFVDGESAGQIVRAYGPTVNAWAALAGAVPVSARGAWAEALRADPDVLPPVTPHDATLLLEAYLHLGLDLHARDLLDRYFGSIVRAGEPTLPEYWMAGEPRGASRQDDSSDCHPYGAGPAFLLPQVVLGVTPAEPGFTRARIAPRTLGLSDARGRVPTPHGVIGVEWTRDDASWRLRIDLPAGVSAELELPRTGRSRERLSVNGQVVWQADPTELEKHRQRRVAEGFTRRVHHHLAAGASHEIELRSV